MKRISIQMAMSENVITLSEINKKRISLRKFFDNWVLIVAISLCLFTLRIAAEELAMKARAAAMVDHER